MKFELNTELVPRPAMEGSQIDSEKALARICDLQVQELKNLVIYWLYSTLENLSQPKEMLPLFYSRKELAEILKLSTTIIDQLIHSGQLRAKFISKRPIVLHSDLIEFIDHNVFNAVLKEPEPEPLEVIEF